VEEVWSGIRLAVASACFPQDADHPFGTAASTHGVVWKHCTMISALLEGTIHSENPSRQSVEVPESDLVGALLQTQKCP
jgi:hypothetical protein